MNPFRPWLQFQSARPHVRCRGVAVPRVTAFQVDFWYSFFSIARAESAFSGVRCVNLSLYIPGDYTYVCCHMAYRALESDRLVVGKDWTADDSVPV